MTGQIPFSNIKFSAHVERAVLNGERPEFTMLFPPASPQDHFVLLIRQCWETDPNNRPMMKRVLEALFTLAPPHWKIQWIELDSLCKKNLYATSDSEEDQERITVFQNTT